MNPNPIECHHLAMAPAPQAEPPQERSPSQMEVRIGGLLERMESKYERRLDQFLREHEPRLKEGYETHSGSRKQATEHAWTGTEMLLNRIYKRLFEAGEFAVPPPTLSADRNGAINMTWRTGPLHLIANIPPEEGQEVEYSYSWSEESPRFGKVALSEAPAVISSVLVDL